MGKSNRIRNVRSGASASKRPQQKDNSRLYSIIVVAIAVFVLLTIVFSTVMSSGVLMRSAKAMKSENYTVTGSMLQYFYASEYNEFVNNYSSYLSLFSLDTSKPLASQTYGKGNETALLGSFEGTWRDYFMSSAESQAKQTLIFCEEAKTRGIELTADDKADIDAAMSDLAAVASLYGYSVDGYVAATYGDGMKIKDIREAMELTTLASKAAEAVDRELMDAITEDEINAKYEEKPENYDAVDYLTYAVGVSYAEVAADVVEGYTSETELTEAQKVSVLAEYEKRIADVRAQAEVFKAYTTVDAFRAAAIEDSAKLTFDKLYTTEALADADKLSDADLEAVKNAMVAKVIAEVNEDKTATDDDTVESEGSFTAYGVALTENAAKAIDDIKADLFKEIDAANDLYAVEKVGYDPADEFPKWAFEEATNIGDTYSIELGDGADGKEITDEKGYFSVDVFFISRPQYRDDTAARNVAYMTFATKEAAEQAISSFKSKSNQDLATFESVAISNAAATSGKLDNYLEGQLSYNGFEAWLYDDETVVGSYTETPLANAATSATEYAVFFYAEDGDEAWHIDVMNAIFVDDYQEYYNTLKANYPITVDEDTVAKVGN